MRAGLVNLAGLLESLRATKPPARMWQERETQSLRKTFCLLPVNSLMIDRPFLGALLLLTIRGNYGMRALYGQIEAFPSTLKTYFLLRFLWLATAMSI